MQKFNSFIHAHSLNNRPLKQRNYIWTISQLAPFNELLISWNALRPSQGQYVILSRLFIQKRWSPWLLYAVWSSKEQFSFHDKTSLSPIHSFQDQVEVLNENTATGFSIRIETYQGASLKDFYYLYACTSNLKSSYSTWSSPLRSFSLSLPKISQLNLPHPRARDLCSSTSTTSVIQYLLKKEIDPLNFAKHVYDSGFDIYGNWSFNMAQAFVELGSQWQCFCTRVLEINWIWKSLQMNLPVVISIKGYLPGALFPYSNGHLIVIKGYDVNTQQFLCMDPAFPTNEQTAIAYPRQALMHAWKRRGYLAYFFFPREKSN